MMKLGILNANLPGPSRINWDGSAIDLFIRFFQSVEAPFDYVGYEAAQGELPRTPTGCDAYVITGSPKSANETDEWVVALSQFIREAYQSRRKLVGICFGHQILAHALGGRVEKSEKGIGFGLKQFDVTTKKAWMSDKPDHCALYYSHQDQVVQLPPEAELLGGSAFCPNALYEINGRVLGIQGHPELTASMMAEACISIKDRMERGMYETAVLSLQNGAPDDQIVGHWIVNFLTQSDYPTNSRNSSNST